jgi:hypothetical protein
MEFKKNGDVVFDGADRVSLALVKELYGGNWERAIDAHIELRKQRQRKQLDWSEDLVGYLTLYGLHSYCAKRRWPAIKVSLAFLDEPAPAGWRRHLARKRKE